MPLVQSAGKLTFYQQDIDVNYDWLNKNNPQTRKTSGEKHREIDFQTPYGGLTAVKHFARILRVLNSANYKPCLGIIFIQPIRVTINILLVKSQFSGTLHQRLSF